LYVVFLLFILISIVLLVVLGGVFVGLALTVLWWALIGLVIGGLGRLVVPGRQPIGLFATALGGIAAALLGGVIARAAHLGTGLQFLVAVGVAAVLVAALCAGQRTRRR
jgi:uncharacterized membrane protein YeaQ/YmgE (transglycosylase-associated protein family)